MNISTSSNADVPNNTNSKPIRSQGGSSTTSPVWKYFKLNENNPIQATCLMCGTLMSRGGVSPSRCGTTNLRRHLSFAHGIVLPSKKKPQGQVISEQKLIRNKNLPQKPKQKKHLVSPGPSNENPPYEICLRWKSYLSNMQSKFPTLLKNEHFVDVTLACEGHSIKCHRVVLSACSSYFEDLLCRTSCPHPIVIIKDLGFQELRTLVDFMYSGEVYIAQEKLQMLLAAAEALQIKGLSGSTTYQYEEVVTDLNETNNFKDSGISSEPSASEKLHFLNKSSAENKLSIPNEPSTSYEPNSSNESNASSELNSPTEPNISTSNIFRKQKIVSSIRQIYKNLPGRTQSLANKSSCNNIPNGIQHLFGTNLSKSCHGHKHKSKLPQIKCHCVTQGENRHIGAKCGGSASGLQDVILSNNYICPAPICQLSDNENTDSEDDDKAWHRDEEMEDDIDSSPEGLLMMPEVVMDCIEDT